MHLTVSVPEFSYLLYRLSGNARGYRNVEKEFCDRFSPAAVA